MPAWSGLAQVAPCTSLWRPCLAAERPSTRLRFRRGQARRRQPTLASRASHPATRATPTSKARRFAMVAAKTRAVSSPDATNRPARRSRCRSQTRPSANNAATHRASPRCLAAAAVLRANADGTSRTTTTGAAIRMPIVEAWVLHPKESIRKVTGGAATGLAGTPEKRGRQTSDVRRQSRRQSERTPVGRNDHAAVPACWCRRLLLRSAQPGWCFRRPQWPRLAPPRWR